MSILQYASPQARYYQADRDILNDYDNRINIYNKALADYRTQAGEYQTKVDAFNETVNAYNADLDAWKKKAEAYNKAIETWNATDRTTPYDEWSGTVASPGEWFGTAPVFQGGDAPVAPNDPGFGQTDVDTFLKQAEGRAIRRGNAAATAQQVMNSPGQYYVAGRENFGVQPEVSLAGMSGFGSSAMGFAAGGPVQNYAEGGMIAAPYADSFGQLGQMQRQLMQAQAMQQMKSPLPEPVSGGGMMMTQALGEDGSAPKMANAMTRALGEDGSAPLMQTPQPLGGVGGLFANQFRNQQMDFGRQMADLQGSPLKNYQNYLMNTYGQRAMENVHRNVQEDVDTFVDLVDQAERAHFGAEESFGYGGGQYHLGMMDQFKQLPQPQQLGMLQGGQAQFENLGTPMLAQAFFADGGAVSGISEEELAAMRQKVINDYGFDPVDVAMEEGVDPELYLRVMWTENKGRQGPRSEAGAIGLMQLMPATARELGVDPNNPLDNARGGARYLRRMMDQFGTVPLALAAYNAGPGNVRRYGGVPPFEETQNYVAMIHGVGRDEITPAPVVADGPYRRPRRRPDDLGTISSAVPEQQVFPNNEYLLAGIGNIFTNFNQQSDVKVPYIPNIMNQQNMGQPEQERGIDFYRQYAATRREGT